MDKVFIVSKNSIDLELCIDGKIEVKPLPHKSFSKETVKVIAEKHRAVIGWYLIKYNKQDVVELVVDYFQNRGFEIKEK